ncbi:MAG TPA: hypothetical protein VGF26_16540, partial [Ramlibacter sp.]
PMGLHEFLGAPDAGQMLVHADRHRAAGHLVQCVERLLPGLSTNTHSFSSLVIYQTGVRLRFSEISSELLPKFGL